ncbi:MAG: hypothetical protein RBU37_11210 [Myxococcota bacterium]|nr:hypothetical protein [Myxococcota bacterium]
MIDKVKMNFRATVSLLCWAGFILSAAPAMAQTVFIPVNFGAPYEPQQVHDELMKAASQDTRLSIIPTAQRDELLNVHFPELTLPNVSELEQRFARGNDSFLNGQYDVAAKELEAALDDASKRLVALSLRTGFADTTYQGGLVLIQVHYFGNGDAEKSAAVVDKLVRLFPTRIPSIEEFPPELIELFQTAQPSSAKGVELTVKVAAGCHARLNGHDLTEAGTQATLTVLPGKYGVAEVCDEQTTRAYVLPVDENTVVDFHDDFAKAYTYPVSLTLNVANHISESQTIASMLGTIGRRLGARHVIGAGLVPEDSGMRPGYRMLLVEVGSGLVREFTVPTSEVANSDGMLDALNALWTGEDFQLVSLDEPGGTNWTTVGAITAGAGAAVVLTGVVFAVLAMQADSDFAECNKTQTCRSSSTMVDSVKDRSRFSTTADILYGTGAAVTITGLVLIIVDQLDDSGSDSADNWHFALTPQRDGLSFGLSTRF